MVGGNEALPLPSDLDLYLDLYLSSEEAVISFGPMRSKGGRPLYLKF